MKCCSIYIIYIHIYIYTHIQTHLSNSIDIIRLLKNHYRLHSIHILFICVYVIGSYDCNGQYNE